MSAFLEERVLTVHHWTDRLFSFTTTRDPALRFSNGHFTMIGLKVNDKPLLRAYSIVSANYEEHLEFLSIKVPDGPLTSRLQHIQVGDTIIVGKKPTGTLLIDYLLPAKRLYMLSTGTGLAPFMSVIRDPEFYEAFEKVVLTHGVREVSELGYADYITHELPANEFYGEFLINAQGEDVVAGIRTFGFYNAGQDCTAACRIYAQGKIYDKFVAAMAERSQAAARSGDEPTAMPTEPPSSPSRAICSEAATRATLTPSESAGRCACQRGCTPLPASPGASSSSPQSSTSTVSRASA